MSALPTPPSSPPTYPTSQILPSPIIEGLKNNREVAQVTLAFAKYYWPLHFERGSVDLASFLEKIFVDYADYEPDILGQWLSLDMNASKMAPLYRLYKACLNYGVRAGTYANAEAAKKCQGVHIR